MSIASTLAEVETRLVRPAESVRFTSAELDGLPDPACRLLTAAIALGTPLALSARLKMRGHIRLGRRWVPFQARQIEAPHDGFVWAARAAGLIVGSDRYVDGVGAMDWKLAGFVTVMHAEGPDVSRSAASRAAAEGIWVPTALLPRFGVTWTADDIQHLTARYRCGDVPVQVRYRIDTEGHIVSTVFDRWGDPDNTGMWSWHPFGGDVTSYRTFDGVSIPSAGRVGWFYGTDRWPDGDFFHYQITDLHLVAGHG